jgi:hypothetical protein
MTIASTIYGGGSLPTGDQFRSGTATSLVTTTDTSILALTTTAGIIHHIAFSCSDSMVANNTITSATTLKVTVDGASERTINGKLANFSNLSDTANAAVTATQPIQFFPLPIKFSDSITIKAQRDNGDRTITATVYYSVLA